MLGTGLPEFIIILLAVLVLFGPAALTFWLGYTMGQKRSETTESKDELRVVDTADEGPEESTDE